MTTRKELGEMLITGKPMQVNLPTCGWTDVDDDEVIFDLALEYRPKPTQIEE